MTNGAPTSDAAPQDPHLGEVTDFLDLRPTDDELRWLMPSGMRVSLDAGFRGSSLDNTVCITGPLGSLAE